MFISNSIHYMYVSKMSPFVPRVFAFLSVRRAIMCAQ